MSETLKSTHNPIIIKAVHKLISASIISSSDTSSLIKHSYIADIGFKGVSDFFRPFPKVSHNYKQSIQCVICVPM